MKTVKSYDYIIVGAGAAGLSLLWHILEHDKLKKKNILLADNTFKWEREKTWCFWDKSLIPEKNWIQKSWERIEVRIGNKAFINIGNEHYHCISSRNFRKNILERVKETETVTIVEAEVEGFEDLGHNAMIRTDKGNFTASHIFQSTHIMPVKLRNGSQLLQHFRGFFVESRKEVFDPEMITLMDFDAESGTSKCTAFFYVLPYSKNLALCEYTLFSDEVLPDETYDAALQRYLNSRFGLSERDYKVNEIEKGFIPMDDTLLAGKLNNRTLNIGTAGGATKPTTGYTFTRIQQHSRHIVKALAENRLPEPFPRSKYRFRLYDHLLIQILKKEPLAGPGIFRQLFRKNKIKDVLLFLDEKSSLADEIKIFASLPWAPFLKALGKSGFGWKVP
ncbi:MAG: hypothetical protein JJU13_09755 [Balneolaceae bacterium]|nr:hypothetical protein [Balneolaceae bacterium]